VSTEVTAVSLPVQVIVPGKQPGGVEREEGVGVFTQQHLFLHFPHSFHLSYIPRICGNFTELQGCSSVYFL